LLIVAKSSGTSVSLGGHKISRKIRKWSRLDATPSPPLPQLWSSRRLSFPWFPFSLHDRSRSYASQIASLLTNKSYVNWYRLPFKVLTLILEWQSCCQYARKSRIKIKLWSRAKIFMLSNCYDDSQVDNLGTKSYKNVVILSMLSLISLMIRYVICIISKYRSNISIPGQINFCIMHCEYQLAKTPLTIMSRMLQFDEWRFLI